jgi:PilZ domain
MLGASVMAVKSVVTPPRVAESRKTRRRRTLLGGRIVYSDGSFSCDCTIRDQSETGARVKLALHETVPARFFLIVKREGVAYEASIAWSTPPEFGLSFHQSFQLNGPLPPHLAFLHKAWDDCRPPLAANG